MVTFYLRKMDKNFVFDLSGADDQNYASNIASFGEKSNDGDVWMDSFIDIKTERWGYIANPTTWGKNCGQFC